jgi:hypothetical protein
MAKKEITALPTIVITEIKQQMEDFFTCCFLFYTAIFLVLGCQGDRMPINTGDAPCF